MHFSNDENSVDQDCTAILRETESRYRSDIWSLVLHSAGIHHVIRLIDGVFRILVFERDFPVADREISHFEEENLNWPPPPVYLAGERPAEGSINPPTVLVMGALLVFFTITGDYSQSNVWFRLGEVNSRAMIYGGEWWRAVTALTLHADSVHLFGNLLIGGFIIHYLCRSFGVGLGWFLVLLSGGIGNILNVMARGPGHISLGFSTAVFGAVGILCGSRAIRTRHGWLKGFLLPLGAACALLAMLGTSGKRTDLGAHLWGLLVGLVLGVAAEFIPAPLTGWLRKYRQALLFVITMSVVYFAWQRALAL